MTRANVLDNLRISTALTVLFLVGCTPTVGLETHELELHGSSGWPVDVCKDMDAYAKALLLTNPRLSAKLSERATSLKAAREEIKKPQYQGICGNDDVVTATQVFPFDIKTLQEAANQVPGKSRDKALYTAISIFLVKEYKGIDRTFHSGSRQIEERDSLPALQAARRTVEANVTSADIANAPLLLAEAFYYQRCNDPAAAYGKLQSALELTRARTGADSPQVTTIDLYGQFILHAQKLFKERDALSEHRRILGNKAPENNCSFFN